MEVVVAEHGSRAALEEVELFCYSCLYRFVELWVAAEIGELVELLGELAGHVRGVGGHRVHDAGHHVAIRVLSDAVH
jgi:hypothetical protein